MVRLRGGFKHDVFNPDLLEGTEGIYNSPDAATQWHTGAAQGAGIRQHPVRDTLNGQIGAGGEYRLPLTPVLLLEFPHMGGSLGPWPPHSRLLVCQLSPSAATCRRVRGHYCHRSDRSVLAAAPGGAKLAYQRTDKTCPGAAPPRGSRNYG